MSLFKTGNIRDGKEQFESLDLLRFIASMMIILFHAHSIALKDSLSHGEQFFPAPIWWYSCIELFFTMSGFLMIHMSRNLYGSARGVKIFAVRRGIRTPPLYWIYTILITAIFLIKPSLSAEGPIDLRTFLCSIFFYPNIGDPVIAIGWTLNYEIFFYCIFGASIFLPFSKGWKFAVAMLIGIVTLGQIFGPHPNPWGVWTDFLMLDFVIGILVAVAFHRGLSFGNVGTGLSFCIGILLILCYRWVGNYGLFRVATMGVGMGCIIAAATLREKPISFGKYGPIITLLSQQTYTMYLCHILVLKCVQLVYFRFFWGFWANLGYIILGTIITLLVAKVLYEAIEKPLAATLRRQVKRLGLI